MTEFIDFIVVTAFFIWTMVATVMLIAVILNVFATALAPCDTRLQEESRLKTIFGVSTLITFAIYMYGGFANLP